MFSIEVINSKLKNVYPMVGFESKIYAALLLLIVAGFLIKGVRVVDLAGTLDIHRLTFADTTQV